MADIEATKFYIRHREKYPETELQTHALLGFQKFGVETVPFYGFGDVEHIDDLGPTVGVAGYVGDVHAALQKMGRPIPENIDYPPELEHMLGRTMRRTTLGYVRRQIRPIFTKPVDLKIFSGFVWTGDTASQRRCYGLDDDVKVWVSDPVEMLAEYRTYILDGEILDCRRYKGDWSKAPSRETVETAVRLMPRQRAYCLDFAVLNNGETVLVERSDAFSMGHYGLLPTLYAKMLSARWHEMATSDMLADGP